MKETCFRDNTESTIALGANLSSEIKAGDIAEKKGAVSGQGKLLFYLCLLKIQECFMSEEVFPVGMNF